MSSNTVANRVGAQNNQLRTRGGLGAKSVPHRLINVLAIQTDQGDARLDENIVIPYDASNSTNDSVNEDDVAFYLQNVPCLLTTTVAYGGGNPAAAINAVLPYQTIEIDTQYVDNSTAAAVAAAAAAGVEGVSNLTHKVEVEFFGEGSNVTGMAGDLENSGPAGANNANEFSQPTSGNVQPSLVGDDADTRARGKTLGLVQSNIQPSSVDGTRNSIMIQRAESNILNSGAATNEIAATNACVLTTNLSMIVRLVKRVRRLDLAFMA